MPPEEIKEPEGEEVVAPSDVEEMDDELLS